METKACHKCGIEKPLEDFPWKNLLRRKRTAVCKECTAKRSNDWYYKNREHQMENTNRNRKRYRQTAKEYVWDYLSTHPCVRCGETNPIVLEFHHRGDKDIEVSRLIGRGASLDSLIAEIAKCDVLCANCHRIVTAEEQNWFRK